VSVSKQYWVWGWCVLFHREVVDGLLAFFDARQSMSKDSSCD
jgi:hypothetical protein